MLIKSWKSPVFNAVVSGDDYRGTLKTVIEDITEELEYVAERFAVNRIILPRKACSNCDTFVQSPLPPRLIERYTRTEYVL